MVERPLENSHGRSIRVYGLVQGVGFRPFLHRIAGSNRITGWAVNSNDCVHIHAEGAPSDLERFVSDISDSAPALARVEHVETVSIRPEGHTSFEIRESTDNSNAVTRVSPDIATCTDCLADMNTQANRLQYPFTNCTNCGPRFSIVEDLPYDRERTTMKKFAMCPSCACEYGDITNRRYHAQPNACAECGPQYTLHGSDGHIVAHRLEAVIQAAEMINGGRILAIKGIGGFHLACDAGSTVSVSALRERKTREGKPFAVMARNIAACRNICRISGDEARHLCSPSSPIVLLALDDANGTLADPVTVDLDTVGVMVPYAPIHHLLFDYLDSDFIVLTSGNIRDEPIAIDDDDAMRRLKSIADAFLCSDRPIRNRADDSVTFVAADHLRYLRRSRGVVPDPVQTDFNVDGIIAAGAELKSTFAMGKGDQLILSQHIGDLKNPETYQFYEEAYSRLTRLFRITPRRMVCDLHPNYLSTRFAEESGLPLTRVQHHYAHIASCIAETGYTDPVIGVSLDGTGYGDDGNIWGSEFFVCDLQGYERMFHLEYVALPGGDAAVMEPWRIAVSHLYGHYGTGFLENPPKFLAGVGNGDIELLCSAIESGINCPLTSSMGRLFDTIAALTGIATSISYEAEGPMRLQAVADPAVEDAYPYSFGSTIDPWPCISSVLEDIGNGVQIPVIAARFHNTVVSMIRDGVQRISAETGLTRVFLSGGVFQNRIVLEKSVSGLEECGFSVYSNRRVPANDGGISLGQAVVAAARNPD